MNNKLFMKGKALPATLFCTALMLAPLTGASSAKAITAVAQQTGTIKGMVVDSNGEPVIGASVIIVGRNANQGTVTDMDGNFVLDAKPGTKLKISYIGYEAQTVTAKNGMRVTMKDDNATSLNAVEVVAYGAQKKVTVTGAIASVKGDELTHTPVGDVRQVLAGQLTGVTTVQNSGEPGADDTDIYVRGQGTFNDAKPLIQVDGVERSMNDVDPEDIESITVLKDASATAVFGVRGANGVILITTKRGEEGKAKISASTSFSILEPTKMVKLANAYDYANYYNMQQHYDNGDEAADVFEAGVIQKFKDHSDPIRFPDTNWIDYIMKKSTLQTKHNVSISGGAKGVRYFISAGMYTQGGLFKEFGMDKKFGYEYARFNYRSNLDIDVTKTTQLSINIAGSHSSKDAPATSGGTSDLVRAVYEATPFSSPGIVDGKFIRTTTSYDDLKLPFTGPTGMTYYNYDGTRGGYSYSSQNTLQMDMQLKQKLDFITKGLSFKIKGSYNSSYSVKKDGTIDMAYYTPVLQEDGSIEYEKKGKNGTSWGHNKSQGKARNWYAEAALNYSRSFGLHNVTGLLLYNQSKNYYPSTYIDIPRGYVGIVARATYNWNNRYMAEVNVGYNGSENFAPKKRYGTFPAFSAGWVASEENWFKALKPVFSFFKARASWGLVGNDKFGDYRFLYTPDEYKTSNGAYRFGIDNSNRQGASSESAKKNPDVTWEKAFKQDYGFDARFLNDRLQFAYDYYFERRKDILLIDYTFPSTLMGFSIPPANKGRMNSWGHEFSIKWQDKFAEQGRYWVGVNLSYNQNKVIENKEAFKTNEYQYQKGHRLGTRALYKFWKFYYEGCEADYEKEFGKPFPSSQLGFTTLKPGDCVFVDLDGDGKVDGNDISYDGTKSDNPKWVIGINLGLTWKDFSINTQWTGAWDVSRLLDGGFRQPFRAGNEATQGGLTQYLVDHSWTKENPSQDAWYPRATWSHASLNYAASTLYEKDSKYLRLKTLQISYNMHFPFMKVVGLRSAKLSLSGYNLLTFTPYKFGDPEAKASSKPSYPLQRTYTATLQLNF